MICLVRSDERLIHGQCMQFIVSDYSIKEIIVVDDMTAANPLLKSIFQNAVPNSIKARVYTVSESVPVIQEALGSNVNTLLLMKHPRTYVTLLEKMEGLPESINIGPQMAKNGVKCVDFATLAPEDIEACKKMADVGIRVFFNATGASGAATEWSAVSSKLK